MPHTYITAVWHRSVEGGLHLASHAEKWITGSCQIKQGTNIHSFNLASKGIFFGAKSKGIFSGAKSKGIFSGAKSKGIVIGAKSRGIFFGAKSKGIFLV